LHSQKRSTGAEVRNAEASHRKKIKLPSTAVIKHQLRRLMFDDLVKEADEAEAAALAEAASQALAETTRR
jgi:hypothetical protein